MEKVAKCLLIIVFCGIVQLCAGQSTNVLILQDSLLKRLSGKLPDSTRIDVLKEISGTWISRNPEKAQAYAIQARELAERTGDSARALYCNLGIGYQYSVYGKSIDAIKTLQLAIRQARGLNKKESEMMSTLR